MGILLCFYDGKEIRYFEGRVDGNLLKENRGYKGFGYDPIFIPKGYEITFAEMTTEEKNKISHRRNAIEKFLEYIHKQ